MSNNQAVIDQCIALAGLAQSIRCVQDLAWKGRTNENDLRSVLTSLLAIDAESAASIFGGTYELNSGLRLLSRQLDPKERDKDPEFVNLAINLIALQSQLKNDQTTMGVLSEKMGLMSEKFRGTDFQSTPDALDSLMEDCSSLYQQTLSKLPMRIQVRGEPGYLQRPDIQKQVRAALLAAIRATFLWRQSGGSRWHFLFKKKMLLQGLEYLIGNPIRD